MTVVDWVIVGFALLLGANGLRQGFLVGALQLAGFAAGALAGSRVGPLVLNEGARSPYAPLFALGGALLLGALLAGLLESAGLAVRRRLRVPGLDALDGGLGALLGAALALAIAWVVGIVALQTPGLELRRDIQRSHVLRALNDLMPPSGFLLNALARFDPLPQLRGPGAQGIEPPRAAIADDPDVVAAAAGVVRILGSACGLGVEGTGWVARDELVVTNAHVVAGQDDTVVLRRGEEPRLPARVVAFDARNDVAVLRVPGLGVAPLPVEEAPAAGQAAAILGFPENGPYSVRAARLGETRTALSQDAYGQGPVERRITTFRGVVRSGNSGGPVVDAGGRVLTTVFAAAVGAGPDAGYGVPNTEVADALSAAGQGAVSTGPCAR